MVDKIPLIEIKNCFQVGDEELLANDTFSQINITGSYSILTLNVNEYGQYKCRILNNFGTAEKIFEVNIKPTKTNLIDNTFVIVLVGILGAGIFVVIVIICIQVFKIITTYLQVSDF